MLAAPRNDTYQNLLDRGATSVACNVSTKWPTMLTSLASGARVCVCVCGPFHHDVANVRVAEDKSYMRKQSLLLYALITEQLRDETV